MSDTWVTKFKGVIANFPVEVQVYSYGGDLRVITEQPENVIVPGSQDGNSTVFPLVISKGDCIHLEGATEQELRQELVEFGFSKKAAEQVIGHTRS